ncbi:cell division protein FtsK [Planotetraspora thailandica]|uniref:Cell division protein FtsK n=1 Tax=Planotetraspora thailandica TaxID=487172 RepID=A0A8J3V361_9ACTN|nr:FtsK/SpoIIIE domain-containing protein [Planotetraspora thailandica]GII53204.1 cell division protein FtsK [Planotetraspora thailandica]
MRITLTVVNEHGHREVLVEGDESATVAKLAAALEGSPGRASNVVRLPRTRAPYDLDRDQRRVVPEAKLWLDGRPLDPDGPVFGLLRDGDLVAADGHAAPATMMDEPDGVAEVRVVGGPGAGAVHRLGLGMHTIGADPACAIAVPDPRMAPQALVLRITPGSIAVEPSAEAHVYDTGRLGGRPLTKPTPWREGVMLACGGTVLALGPVEPPDAHLDALPDGGLAYNRPPRLRQPEASRRIVVPVEPKRAEGIRLQLLAALLPAVFGLVMFVVFRQWYFLLITLMTPMIMVGQWAGDRRHGKKKHRQALKAYKERLAAVEEEIDTAVVADEKARRAGAPDPAEVLLTATGPRRRLWERRIHDDDALRLRVGLADLPADLDFEPEGGMHADAPPREQPTCYDVPVALVMRRLGVAGVTGPREVALGCARWLVGQAAALHSPRDLAIVVLSAHDDSDAEWGWVRWLPHCAGPSRQGLLASDSVALVGPDPESAARRVAELNALIAERLDADGKGGAGPYEQGPRLTGGPTGWADLGLKTQGLKTQGRKTQPDADPAFTAYDERPFDVLVVLDGAQVLRGLPAMPQVLRQGPRAGVYTIAVDDDQRLLPEECATVVTCDADGTVRLRGGGLDPIGGIRADQVSASWADRLGRALAPLRDVSRDDPSSALPESARLLDLLGPLDVPKGWGRSTRAVIGVGPEGPFEVDISRDGPHALVAGTTGAGKSELLQTLICSLAVANRPDEMTFVLIDYKGGAAFKECVRLPHTVGMVSDLDGHLTQRALSSLAAEIRRRERVLLDAGAKDVDDYHRMRSRGSTWVLGAGGVRKSRKGGGNGIFGDPGTGRDGSERSAGHPPLPRLVLVIDEFAAMVSELPDFVEGLVDIARRGRSLGIHLILATQRPGGVVTADIQANTSLRIALRVTDSRESADVIDAPDAAHISRTTPGRCYVRTGSAAPVAVQTARIGGRIPGGEGRDADEVRVVDLPWSSLGHPLEIAVKASSSAGTDLAMLVDVLTEAGRGIPEQPSPWLPPLSDHITLEELPEPPKDTRPRRPYQSAAQEVPPLAFGLTDMPWEQETRPLVLDLRQGGHLLVAGTARSGRSTVLRTVAGSIASSVSPEDVHIHAIDCGSGALLPLVGLPHCGAVVTRDQLDRVDRLLTRLRAEVGRRQQLLAEAGYASLAEAREAARSHTRAGDALHDFGDAAGRLPWLVLMVDRWEGYVAAFENYDYGRLVDALLQLLREGPAVGLRAVVTSDRSGLLGQISTLFEDRLVLRLADPADYGLAGLPVKNLPRSMPPGRALSVGEHGLVESQIALLADDPAGPAQVAALQELARTARDRFGGSSHRRGTWAWRSEPPLRVDALPVRITADQVLELDESFEPPSPLWALLGAGGDTLTPLGVDLLGQGPAAVVAGPPRSGRSSCLLTAARSLLQRGIPVIAVTPRRSPLRDLAGSPGVLAVLDGNSRSVGASEADDFGGLPGANDPLALVSAHKRYVMLVDDAELISPESMLGLAVEEILRMARDGEHGLLVAGATGDLATAYRGFAAEARKSRTGLLLSVQSPADGDLFSVRLPRGAVGGPPGRGLLVISGTATPIQAALPA